MIEKDYRYFGKDRAEEFMNMYKQKTDDIQNQILKRQTFQNVDKQGLKFIYY